VQQRQLAVGIAQAQREGAGDGAEQREREALVLGLEQPELLEREQVEFGVGMRDRMVFRAGGRRGRRGRRRLR